jgi:hypothetical protein
MVMACWLLVPTDCLDVPVSMRFTEFQKEFRERERERETDRQTEGQPRYRDYRGILFRFVVDRRTPVLNVNSFTYPKMN